MQYWPYSPDQSKWTILTVLGTGTSKYPIASLIQRSLIISWFVWLVFPRYTRAWLLGFLASGLVDVIPDILLLPPSTLASPT